ncbi:MAG TPA: hypothetical protein PKD58_05075 [Candidatus Sumerlaeota bacterium]|nr:hypothetical protein [Candidatus Sumerlaeota bacterium]HMZ51882.1 hypothetical protein [Candidatus Sumerlaeota bacterium]
MIRKIAVILAVTMTVGFSGCARSGRVKQLEAELFVAQSQIKSLQDRINSLENASVGSTNSLAGRVEEMEKTMGALKGRSDKVDAETTQLTERITTELESLKKNVAEVLAAKKQMDENMPQLSKFTETNKKVQEDVAKLQREYGQRLRDLETKAEALRSDVTALNGAYDKKTEDYDRRFNEVRSDLARRIDTTNTDVLALRNSTKDSVDDLKKALDAMGTGIVEILRLQRSQFTNLRDEYDSSMSKIEPYLPKNTLGDAESKKDAASPAATSEKKN